MIQQVIQCNLWNGNFLNLFFSSSLDLVADCDVFLLISSNFFHSSRRKQRWFLLKMRWCNSSWLARKKFVCLSVNQISRKMCETWNNLFWSFEWGQHANNRITQPLFHSSFLSIMDIKSRSLLWQLSHEKFSISQELINLRFFNAFQPSQSFTIREEIKDHFRKVIQICLLSLLSQRYHRSFYCHLKTDYSQR